MFDYPPWKTALTLGVCLAGAVFAAPNFVPAKLLQGLPDWVPHRQVSLGLDLQGGAHLLLEVDVGAVIRERMETAVEAVRAELRGLKIPYEGLGAERTSVQVTIKDAARVGEALDKLKRLEAGFEAKTEPGGRIVLALSEQAVALRAQAAVQQSIEIVRRRIDETGVREPTIQRQGSDRILVQLPGIDDPERVKRLLGKTAKMTFHLVDPQTAVEDAIAGRVPAGSRLAPAADESGRDGRPRMYVIQKRVMVSGDRLVDAQPSFDQRTKEPVVTFRFDTEGAKKFGDTTQQNVGRLFAIVLDGKVISAPVIREAILGGSGQISGSFTVQSANDLALLLRAGALPAPLTVLEERSVGPGLGADSIAAGKVATVIGTLLVAAFMIVSYGFFGIIANLAMVSNGLLLLAAMSALQATLTLPGIAGIVLTMGMAVDSNVLIFERMREEIRAGRTPISAIDAGFSRALVAIVDSNLTTLIAALALFMMGSGPVKGFGVTLAIGIVTTMFTAVTLTKLMVVSWYRFARPKTLAI